MKLSFFTFSLWLFLVGGFELHAQHVKNTLSSCPQKYSDLSFPKITKNGRWFILRKEYHDHQNDTVLIFDKYLPNNPIAKKIGVKNFFTVGETRLLLEKKNEVELFDAKKKLSFFFKEVRKVQVLKNKEHFVLLYNQVEKNSLELRDAEGNLLNRMGNVRDFHISANEDVYVIEDNEQGNSIILLNGELKPINIYTTSNKINSLNTDPSGKGMIIHELNKGGNEELYYLNLKTNKKYRFNDILPIKIKRAFTEVVKEGVLYFIRAQTTSIQKKKSGADIWYGKDNRLEEKFYPPTDISAYTWEPSKYSIQHIGKDKLNSTINIGDNRYFLIFDPYQLQDYSRERPLIELHVYDRLKDNYSLLDTISPALYISRSGKFALSRVGQKFSLYQISSGLKKGFSGNKLKKPYFDIDSEKVLFEGENGLYTYNTKSGKLKSIVQFKGFETAIINGNSIGVPTRKASISRNFINLRKPLLVKLYNSKTNQTAYVLWFKGKIKTIIPPTKNFIRFFKYTGDYKIFYYIEENYNMPPRFVSKGINEKKKVLYQSNPKDTATLSLKQEIVSYSNSNGLPLHGILYYPIGYDPTKKYPMIVHVYEKQYQNANKYLYPSFYDGLGFNIRLFLERGYFVYLPDIIIQGEAGPGIDALDCINHALDALNNNALINKQKIGLIGHSFGGYETNFIATHSDRFAAYISGSGHSDIIWDYFSFNYNFYFPDYIRIQANMYKMGVPFSKNKSLYLKNNPLYNVKNVNAPVLLWSGSKDKNVPSSHTMAFFNALSKNGKKVIALYYKDEGHSLEKETNQIDLTKRIMEWFDYFLKEKKYPTWIEKKFKKGAF